MCTKTGISLSIMANVVKGSFTSDQAVSGHTLKPQHLMIYFDPVVKRRRHRIEIDFINLTQKEIKVKTSFGQIK